MVLPKSIIRTYVQLFYVSTNIFFTGVSTVAGIVMETYKLTDSSSVLSWSPPNPPNGIILYYNIRITHSDSGELVATVEAFSNTTIDISDYIDSNGKFNVEVCIHI